MLTPHLCGIWLAEMQLDALIGVWKSLDELWDSYWMMNSFDSWQDAREGWISWHELHREDEG